MKAIRPERLAHQLVEALCVLLGFTWTARGHANLCHRTYHGKERPGMSLAACDVDRSTLGLHTLEQYAPLIGTAATERILGKAHRVRTQHLVHVSSTFYGGGVAEILTPLTLMMNAAGIETGWRIIQGTPAFFGATKKLHNALQGDSTGLSKLEREIYEQVAFENALRLHLEDCDAVIVHDPQPLALVKHYAERELSWIWQCHIDVSAPDPATWSYLRGFIECYDTAIFSLAEYAKDLGVQQRFIAPAINPLSAKNCDLTEDEIDASLARHRIPTDRPLIVQVSRFDRWKDPLGVIAAFHKARSEVDCALVLVGNSATDDPEGETMLETIYKSVDESVTVLTADDPLLVNALQRRAAVVLQKSTREGFGLTVTEAMWKGAAVIGGNVGGIRRQITDGENGFLVDSVDQAAARIVQLVRNPALRARLGGRARETVRENFLMSRLFEDWLDLLALRQQAHD
jgi:trehalose synthase